jgi:hypothetical protein
MDMARFRCMGRNESAANAADASRLADQGGRVSRSSVGVHPESRYTFIQFVQQLAWVAFPIAGMLWVATRYGHGWYHGDEWGTIDLTLGSKAGLRTAFAGYNGHLQAPTYGVYWLQRTWLGVEAHQLVWIIFLMSLAALQLSIAAVLHRLHVPTLVALLAATVVTFFGAGSQNMNWEFQLGVNFAIALCLVAAFVALREEINLWVALGVAALLVLAWVFDSQLAAPGAAYVGLIVLLLWPRRYALPALGPPLIAFLGWFAFGDNGRYLPTSVGTMTSFSWHLLTLSAGGLVGAGETKRSIERILGGSPPSSPTIPLSGEVVGIIVLALATVCVTVGIARHRASRRVIVNLCAGLLATLIAVAILAKTRAFLIPPDLLPGPGSRFLQLVAIFLVVGFLPAVAAAVRPVAPMTRQWVTAAACVALVAVFVLNLDQLRPVREFEEAWGTNVKTAVRQTVAVLNEGCGPGRAVDPRAKPTKQSPEITVRLLQDLIIRGDLTRDFGTRATPEVRNAVCRSTNA